MQIEKIAVAHVPEDSRGRRPSPELRKLLQMAHTLKTGDAMRVIGLSPTIVTQLRTKHYRALFAAAGCRSTERTENGEKIVYIVKANADE